MSASRNRARTTAPSTDSRRAVDLQPHPQADVVPALSVDVYEALRTDIAERGILVALEITAENVVVDGHARLRAARELGIDRLNITVVSPRSELEHILRAALHRRQLTASQRAALAFQLLPFEEIRAQARQRQRRNLRRGPEAATLPAREQRSRELVATLSGAGERTVQDVIAVHEHDPALFEQVRQGRVSASSAASTVRRRERDAAIPPAPAPPEGPFELIYADPPWQFGSPNGKYAPEQHYPTMDTEAIKQLPIPAAADSVLFLWAVNALLPEALEVIEAWGFRYRSNLVWVKPWIGPGIWLRQRHEPLLVASRGRIQPPQPEQRCDSVIEAKRGRHSEKPSSAYERIEQMYPQLTKLELFARGAPRTGWQTWGNQVDEATPV